MTPGIDYEGPREPSASSTQKKNSPSNALAHKFFGIALLRPACSLDNDTSIRLTMSALCSAWEYEDDNVQDVDNKKRKGGLPGANAEWDVILRRETQAVPQSVISDVNQ
ncbi:hypothetical protein Tco_0824868 [Tanacetum coccineum]